MQQKLAAYNIFSSYRGCVESEWASDNRVTGCETLEERGKKTCLPLCRQVARQNVCEDEI